jgi:K+/H+ antiporter YhaU regulatory subunit KhtT
MKLTILALSAALACAGCSDAQNRKEFAAELSALREDIESEIVVLKQEVSEAKDLRRDIETETFMCMEDQRDLADQQKEILNRLSDLERQLRQVELSVSSLELV